MRQRLHDKSEAFLRVFPNSTLPSIDFFHTLTPLQGASQSSQARYGHANTVYKAISERDGKTYCLRRIHDLRVTADTEHAIRTVRSSWNRVKSGSAVSVHFAFTTSKFGDASVIIVSDYHPASETLSEKYFSKSYPRPGRSIEDTMWSFVVQLASAIKAIHSANLVAGIIDRTKILVTDENRIRLNGCAIQDVLDNRPHDAHDLQRQDFQKCGRLISDLAQNLAAHHGTKGRGTDLIHRNYSARLIDVFKWFSDHTHPDNHSGIDQLLTKITADIIDVFDASLKANDILQATLNRELENSRLARLLFKLNCLNERPEYEHDRSWSNHGSRAVLPLFRDYVFHQVDAQGGPVLNMAHMLACLNKLDVGVEEKISLTTRDEQSVITVSFKELKHTVDSAYAELMRRTTG
ncbi:PAB-dependent poly(A)-specific ribonuclease subunit 3 [Lecanora helva]